MDFGFTWLSEVLGFTSPAPLVATAPLPRQRDDRELVSPAERAEKKRRRRRHASSPKESPRSRHLADVDAALELKFESPSRTVVKPKTEQTDTATKMAVMQTAKDWGYRKGAPDSDKILCAAARQIAFDEGYPKPWSANAVRDWFSRYEKGSLAGLRRKTEQRGNGRRRGPRSLEDKYGKATILLWYRKAEKEDDKMTWKQMSRWIYKESAAGCRWTTPAGMGAAR